MDRPILFRLLRCAGTCLAAAQRTGRIRVSDGAVAVPALDTIIPVC
jgi:hypothetical protein